MISLPRFTVKCNVFAFSIICIYCTSNAVGTHTQWLFILTVLCHRIMKTLCHCVIHYWHTTKTVICKLLCHSALSLTSCPHCLACSSCSLYWPTVSSWPCRIRHHGPSTWSEYTQYLSFCQTLNFVSQTESNCSMCSDVGLCWCFLFYQWWFENQLTCRYMMHEIFTAGRTPCWKKACDVEWKLTL